MASENESKYRDLFDKFDLDKSGFITARELVCVFHAMGKSDEEARDLTLYVIKESDKDEDSKVSLDEFLTAMLKRE